MDLSDTREEAAFREKARTWLEANLPKGVANRGFALAIDEESVRALTDWQRRLWEAGYLGLSWPKEYGGQGASMIESAIFKKFGLTPGIPESVKVADTQMLFSEKDQLINSGTSTMYEAGKWGPSEKRANLQIARWSPEFAETMFLDRFRQLFQGE